MLPDHRPALGISFAICAVACFAAADLTTKQVAAIVPVTTATWVRYAIQVGIMLLVTRKVPMRLALGADLALHVLRGLLQLISGVLGIVSLRYMHVGEFSAIVVLTPVVTAVAAAAFFDEQISRRRWGLILLSMCGAVLSVGAADTQVGWWLVVPIALLMTGAGFQLLTSRMVHRHDPASIHLYTGIVCLAVSSLSVQLFWTPLGSWVLWAQLVFQGVACALGHYLLIVAFRVVPVSVLTPFIYLQVAFGAMGSWWVFSHLPTVQASIGILIVVSCGLASAWLTTRERGVATS